MGGWRTRMDETGYCAGRWHRGRFFLGAASPWVSLAGGLPSTCICCPAVDGLERGEAAASTLGRVPTRGLHAGGALMEVAMKTLHRRCAGLDVHKDERGGLCSADGAGKASHEVRRFATTTRGLLELADWLEAQGCTHVAMEATGVYWKPVWHILEGRFELVLANAAHISNVPGRKSDVNDATWIADLLAHGLIRASFVPPAADPGAARPDADAGSS